MSVGTRYVPRCFIMSSASSSMNDPCSIESIPARIARFAPSAPCACAAVFRRNACASSTIAFSSSCVSCGVSTSSVSDNTPPVAQVLNAIVDEAHALRRKTAAHAHGAEGAKRAIRAGIDSIEHGSFMDDEALDMMKQRGTYLVPTLIAAESLREKMEKGLYLPPVIAEKARKAIAAKTQMFQHAVAKGVKIGFGTDAAVYPHGHNAEEFHLMVELGMKPIDALRSAASADAELLGLADKIGTLQTGKLADVVAVPGDPAENIRRTEQVFFVMKEGVIYKNERQK